MTSLDEKRRGERSPTVLHVFATLERGGAEMRTLEAIDATQFTGIVHDVLTVSGRTGPLQAGYLAAGGTVFVLKIKELSFVFRLWRLLRSRKYAVVHSHIQMWSGLIILVAWCAGVRVRIAHFRSDGSQERTTRYARCFTVAEALMKLLICRYATSILGVTESSLSGPYGPSWRTDARCRVIPNGIPLDRWASASPSVLPPYGDPNVVRLLHVGRDIPEKNRDLAVRVLSVLPLEYHLVFAGRQTEARRCQIAALAEDLGVSGRLHLLNERDDMPQVMKACSILLLTSTREGLPGVVLEARAAGLPVVATRLPGCEFISKRIGGVELVESDLNWVDWAAIIQAVGASNEVARSLQGSEFDVDISSRELAKIWRGE